MAVNPSVSVIVPTFGRPHFMEPLVRVFRSQTHESKELLVFDDNPTPSAFLQGLDDPAIRYLYSPQRLSIGAKRDLLVQSARGEVVVHFDDDDYYAPGYLSEMLRRLDGADLVKLGNWFVYDVRAAAIFYWDTSEVRPFHFRVPTPQGPQLCQMANLLEGDEGFMDKVQWGYGFNYVYRREVALQVRWDRAQNKGEDYDFLVRLRNAGKRLRAVPDDQGLVLHLLHSSNTSCVFPNYRLPPFFLKVVFGQGVLDYLAAAGAPVGEGTVMLQGVRN